MISIAFDLSTGIAKLTQPATIKLGAEVPVRVVFLSGSPGEVGGMEFALGTNDASADVLAYTDGFAEENETTWSALLDANDTRLADFLAGKTASPVIGELVCVLDGVRRVAANLGITVQPRVIDGPETSEGGPTYYTQAQVDALIAGATLITDAEDGHTYRLVSTNGVLGMEQNS